MLPRGPRSLGRGRLAFLVSRAEGGLSLGVVFVLTQQDLDKTGRLSTAEKQQEAVEHAYPRVWKRIEAVQDELGGDAEGMDVDVIVRISEGAITDLAQVVSAVHSASPWAAGSGVPAGRAHYSERRLGVSHSSAKP